MVCSDQALAAVARAAPGSIDELAALPEIGPIAARRLGPRLLAALATATTTTA
jgi:ribonuclease D